MTSRILFTLKGSKIFSKNRRDAYLELSKIIKNSMLFFDEVVFESGAHQVNYGDTGTFEFLAPYKGKDEYVRLRESYVKALDEKKPFVLTITPSGSDKSFPVISTDAFSYYLSFEGELDIIRDNFSSSELNFIKLLHIDNRKVTTLVNEYE